METTYPAGTTAVVDFVKTIKGRQGLAVAVVTPTGIFNVFDETDSNGLYPLERI